MNNISKVDKLKVISFFNTVAESWDEATIRHEDIIKEILDNANVCERHDILDVACGTGVLIPDYLKRNVRSITAIDVSDAMIDICKEKYNDEKVDIICADIYEFDTDKRFDNIIVYDAFPHFADAKGLIEKLSGLLKNQGVLTVAHSTGRKRLDAHHKGCPEGVSVKLMHMKELEKIFSEYLSVEVAISKDDIYQITGRKINNI